MDYSERVTPENIGVLKENEVLVYATNMAGKPVNKWALFATDFLGARRGTSFGMTGRAFAIPTVNENMASRLPLYRIQHFVEKFIDMARKRQDKVFLVTNFCNGIGCHSVKDIAPLFAECIELENVYLPEDFWEVLNEGNA